MTFVAMGSPKQEFFMNELKKVHNSTYMGLGGSFDIYSGLKLEHQNYSYISSLNGFTG